MKKIKYLLAIIFIMPNFLFSQNINGLTGNYFDNPDFTAWIQTRIDTVINFDWGSGAPDDPGDLWGMGHTDYSVRWTGCITPLYNEAYTFYTSSNDAARLWLTDTTNTPIIDDWGTHSETEISSTAINLTAGTCYPVKLEYREDGGTAQIRLKWESTNQPKSIIASSQLKTIITSINEISKHNKILVYPNPVVNTTTIYFSNNKNENYSLIITDFQGRQIEKYSNITYNKTTINCEDLLSGLYFFTLCNQNNGNVLQGKFIINK